MFELSEDEFREVVARALDDLPEEFASKLDNVDVVVEDYPPREIRRRTRRGTLILGLYHGIPHKGRGPFYGQHQIVFPDRISLYKKNIEAVSASREQVYQQIRKTLLHEIGHHFSMKDKDLRDIGW